MSVELAELPNMLTARDGPPSREAVERLTEHMLALPQVDLTTRHYRAGNLYAREVTIPAGVSLVGAVCKVPHVCTISSGRILVTTDHGPREFEAGTTLECAGGTARVGMAIEDTIWVAYFALPDKLTGASLAEIEAHLVDNPEALQSNRLLETNT